MKFADIPAVHRILSADYIKHRAPIVELMAAQTSDPFKILVTTILSSRTRDQTTAAVASRLFERVSSAAELGRMTARELQTLIFPIGFYRTKTKHLKELPAVLKKEFGGRIPQTVEELCLLPGVGRKVANLVVAVAFNKPAVCVDVHVHRICNRLGLLVTKTPFETEMTLRRILPEKYWITWNGYLVSFGQRTCNPQRPKCGLCPIAKYCDKNGVNTPGR
jgi:endonuclease III